MPPDAEIDFLIALAAHQVGADSEELLQAAGKVIDCHQRLPEDGALEVEILTGHPLPLSTYSDGAHAIRRWLAMASTGRTKR